MKNLAFSTIKAPLVLALPIGATFQTRRPITWAFDGSDWAGAVLPARERGYIAWWPTPPSEALAEFTKKQYATGHMPRYRPGDVCYIGVPHWRLQGPGLRVWDAWTRLTREEGGFLERENFREDMLRLNGDRKMAGRYLPAWAATAWVRILSVGPQRLQDISEEDAIAELVEHGPADCAWRDYLTSDVGAFPPKVLYDEPTARESYATLIDAIDGIGTWEANPWVWRIAAERIAKPEGEKA